jgi:putative membrane protein
VVSLPEVVMRAATDSAGTLDNRLVTVSGFTLIRDGGVDLGRVVIVCCAGDAQLARVHLTGPGATAAAGYPEDTWLRIEGTVVSGSASAAASFVPTMTLTGVTKIDRPANTYAY